MNKIEKYFSEARIRSKRRKSPWNILLFILGYISIGTITFFMSRFIIYMFQPADTPFSRIASGHDLELTLVVVPAFVVAIPWGFLLTNLIVWFIVPARKVFNAEAEGHKGCSFKDSMAGLFKLALIVSFIGIPIAIYAASRIKF